MEINNVGTSVLPLRSMPSWKSSWPKEGGNMSSRYIYPFEVLRWVGKVAYDLALPPSLLVVHLMFYMLDGSHKLQHEELDIRPGLSYEEETMQILNRSWRISFRRNYFLWKCFGHNKEEATWEHENEMWWRFRRLFLVEDNDSRY